MNQYIVQGALPSSQPLPRIQATEIKPSQIKLIEAIWKDEFTINYRASYRVNYLADKIAVTVKAPNLQSPSVDTLSLLLKEAAVMSQLSHENIIKLIGVVFDGSPMIVLEDCEYGTLHQYLGNDILMSPMELLQFAEDISRGMAYLSSQGICHRELKSSNVWVDVENRCKIGNYVRASDYDDKRSFFEQQRRDVLLRWIDPAVLEHGEYSECTDVWSYGVVLYEIWTQGELPYYELSNDKVVPSVLSGYRLPCPEGCPDAIYSIMTTCWAPIERRPRFETLATKVQSYRNDWFHGLKNSTSENSSNSYNTAATPAQTSASQGSSTVSEL